MESTLYIYIYIYISRQENGEWNEILLAVSEGKIPRNNNLNVSNILPHPSPELYRRRSSESSSHFTRAHLSMNPRTAAMIHRVMESNLFPRIRLSGCRFAINANRVLIIRKSDHQPCFGHVLASTRWPIPRLEMSYTRLDTRRSTPLRALVCTTCTEYNARRRGNCRREMERAYRAHLRANRENVRLTRLRPVIERPGVVVVVVVVVSS